jgi:hypothetical protein
MMLFAQGHDRKWYFAIIPGLELTMPPSLMDFAAWQEHIKFKGSFVFRDVFLKDPSAAERRPPYHKLTQGGST